LAPDYFDASGGPFRETPANRLGGFTAEESAQASDLEHGPEDHDRFRRPCSTKGLKMIEAHWLFGVEMKRVEVVIYPAKHRPLSMVDSPMARRWRR